MVSFIRSDLEFMLQQILIAEQHAAGADFATLVGDPTLPFGLRTVDGSLNNLVLGQSGFGAADRLFPRLLPADFRDDADGDAFGPITNTNYGAPGSVADADPRIISNLIVDQTVNNPAAIEAWLGNAKAVAAWQEANPGKNPVSPGGIVDPLIDVEITNADLLIIPNVAPDEGLSASFNSWMTLFGQFFDHGLDLVTKGGNGAVFIPLQPDDPLITHGPDGIAGNGDEVPLSQAFMVLTRATPTGTEHTNTTTPFVDQNQTYTSHASHQVFLREYVLDGNGDAVATGRLLEGGNGGLATWADVKTQAANLLGITLTDADVTNVPLLATDAYGRFIPGPNGLAQIVTSTGLVEGVPGGLAIPANTIRTGHAFLDDIAHTAAPNGRTADANTTADDHFDQTGVAGGASTTTYDDELLDRHFITGDGRGNENIGLTTVHHVFHSEHNRLVDHIKSVVLSTGDQTFIGQWLVSGANQGDGVQALEWNGERLFQAARFGTEMQYQHLVFEEFARKVQPEVNIFAGYDDTIDPAIVAEFAHTVYRFGHSMLTDTVARVNADGTPNDIGLIEAFLNPIAFNSNGTISDDVAAGAVIRGMTRQVANEIDEFVVGSLRNNLLGLPLDLPSINIARGRDTGIPTLNDARRQFYDGTGDSQLKPYESWADFGLNLKNPASLINFIAAYGTHSAIVSQTTLADKRLAALELVTGVDQNGDLTVASDRLEFLNSTGAWAAQESGLNLVDLWIGGLAERLMPFGGLLGSTFNFVFETQLEKLQDGDRLYYLHRLAGTNFLTELENNSFTSLVEKNTDLGTDGMHLPGDVFSTPDFILEVDPTKQIGADPVGQVVRDNPATPGADTNYLRFIGGEHVVLGGTAGNDTIIADDGDDTAWGDAGNDRIEGGAGNDILVGGDGDDIITDSFGIDNIKGGAGNDVISAGAGTGDLILAGDGKDFVVAGRDPKETFGGNGDDYIIAGDSADVVFGDAGDDWIEGGDQADLLQGDHGNPFQDSTTVGNDVIIGDGGNDDYDSESGDDIMVAGVGTERFEGMLGYDWVTNKGNNAADFDMFFTGLLPPDRDAIRDRFDLVEGLSGGNVNDILRGDNRTAAELSAIDPASGQNHALNTAQQVALINGLQAVLGGATSFNGGNILLGGDGNDILEGRGGNDILDGDRWLNVRISVRANPDGTGPELFSVDSMKQLQAQMFAGTINPGQLVIVREIVNAATPGDVDTAVFSGARSDYSVTLNGDGSVTVTDNVGTEGTDTLRNIEQLGFADGLFAANNPNFDINVAPTAIDDVAAVGSNTPVTLNVLGNDIDPNVGQVLRITAINATPVLEGDAPVAIASGTVQLVSGRLVFTPNPGFTGTAEFDYTVSDGNGGTAVGQVAVTVGGSGNTAPVITAPNGGAATTLSFLSLSTAAVADVDATDAQTLVGSSFSLLGPDAARFNIDANGVLRFVTPPNFNAPTDVGADRTYNVTVRLTDAGGLFDEQAFTVNVISNNQAPTGNVLISDTSPTEGVALTLTNQIVDPNGTTPGAFSFQWQMSVNGTTWTNVATGASFTPAQAQVGNLLRVVTTYTDNGGNAETVISAPTTIVGDLIIGNNTAETFVGTEGDDSISGLGGADVMDGNGGADTLNGGAGADTIRGGAGNDSILGGNGADVLRGGLDNDTIDGGAGNDVMTGNGGNDTYVVGEAGDTVTEAVGEGNDTVLTTLGTLSLATFGEVENLTFTGAGNFTGTGNGLANIITGGAGNDALNGGGGVDTLNGGAGADTLTGGTGADVIDTGAPNDNVADVIRFSAANEYGDTVSNFDATGTAAQVDRIEFGGALRTAFDDGNTNGAILFATGNGAAGAVTVTVGQANANAEALLLTGANGEGVTGANLGNAALVAAAFNAEFNITAANGEDALLVINDTDGNDFAVWQWVQAGGGETAAAELTLIGIVHANGAATAADFGFF